jgi:hypothetical protein
VKLSLSFARNQAHFVLAPENFLNGAFHFGKAKSAMLKIGSSDAARRWTQLFRFGKRSVRSHIPQPVNIR